MIRIQDIFHRAIDWVKGSGEGEPQQSTRGLYNSFQPVTPRDLLYKTEDTSEKNEPAEAEEATHPVVSQTNPPIVDANRNASPVHSPNVIDFPNQGAQQSGYRDYSYHLPNRSASEQAVQNQPVSRMGAQAPVMQTPQQTPMMQQHRMPQQSPIMQMPQQAPMAQQTPAMPQQAPMMQQNPAMRIPQQAPMMQQTPNLQQAPMAQQNPMMQQTPMMQQGQVPPQNAMAQPGSMPQRQSPMRRTRMAVHPSNPSVPQSEQPVQNQFVEYIMTLRSRMDCRTAITYMKENASVFVNMEYITDEAERQSCVDILYGAIYTLNCRMNAISPKGIYLISAPMVKVFIDDSTQTVNMPAESEEENIQDEFSYLDRPVLKKPVNPYAGRQSSEPNNTNYGSSAYQGRPVGWERGGSPTERFQAQNFAHADWRKVQ